MAAGDQGFAAGVPSISLKHATNELVGLPASGSFVFDDSGAVENLARAGRAQPPKSMKKLLRRAVQPVAGDDGNTYLYLQTASGVIIRYLQANAGSITTAAHIINAVRAAYAASAKTAADFTIADNAKTFNPHFGDTKEMIARMLAYESNGNLLLDDVGGTFTSGLQRSKPFPNLRVALRNLVRYNSTTGKHYLQTKSSQITEAIIAAAPASVTDFKSAIAAFNNATSSGVTPASAPSTMPSSSMMQMLSKLINIDTFESQTIDSLGRDTFDDDDRRRASLLRKVADLLTDNSEVSPSRFLKSAHGYRWKRVAELNPTTATITDIVAAMTSVEQAVVVVADLESTSNELFTIADAASLRFAGTDFYCAIYAIPESLPGSVPVSKYSRQGSLEEWQIEIGSNGSVLGLISADGGSEVAATLPAGTVTAGTRTFLELWHRTGIGIGIRVNRGTPGTLAHAGGMFAGAAPIRVGASGAANGTNRDLFDGRLANLFLSDRVPITGDGVGLPDETISLSLYNNGFIPDANTLPAATIDAARRSNGEPGDLLFPLNEISAGTGQVNRLSYSGNFTLVDNNTTPSGFAST